MHLIRQVAVRNQLNLRHLMRTYVSSSNVRANSAAPAAAASSSPGLTVPVSDGASSPLNPKLLGIVNDIAKLNLLEVSELGALLKKTLNLPDAPVVSYAAGPAGAAAPTDEEDDTPKQKVQTAFTIKLIGFDDKQKVALIKECKNQLEGMNLVAAKKFVESAPTIIKADIPKDEAEKLKEAFEKVGATVEIK